MTRPGPALPIEPPIAVVVAHPDDETLGLGAQLARLPRLRLIHLTDGAPRDLDDAHRAGFTDRRAYAAARTRELSHALHVLGVRPQARIAYAYVDQEAAFNLAAIADRLCADLAGTGAVVTHAFEHGHPDHDAAAFGVHAACALLARAGRPVPHIIEFASYHLAPDGGTAYGDFPAFQSRPTATEPLTPAQRARKRRALACFATQRAVLAPFPLDAERLRLAPHYDFLRAPPAPGAWYDCRGWRVTSAIWRACAARALAELGLVETVS